MLWRGVYPAVLVSRFAYIDGTIHFERGQNGQGLECIPMFWESILMTTLVAKKWDMIWIVGVSQFYTNESAVRALLAS